MDGFMANVGLLAVAFFIVYIYKKALEWNDYRHSGIYESEKVYKAADEFVHGALPDEVKESLVDCDMIDETDAENIMTLATHHRSYKDGGYRAFIRSVNEVLGEDVYSEKCPRHDAKR